MKIIVILENDLTIQYLFGQLRMFRYVPERYPYQLRRSYKDNPYRNYQTYIRGKSVVVRTQKKLDESIRFPNNQLMRDFDLSSFDGEFNVNVMLRFEIF